MREYRFELTPVPASRPQMTKRGQTYYPARHRAYEQALRPLIDELEPYQFDFGVPWAVYAEFVLPRFKTSCHPFPRTDVDNLFKLPIDVMTSSGKFWKDDHEITEAHIYKRFARENEEPHSLFRLSEGAPAKI